MLANGIRAVRGRSLMGNTDGVRRITTNMQLQESGNGLNGSDFQTQERRALNRTKENFSQIFREKRWDGNGEASQLAWTEGKTASTDSVGFSTLGIAMATPHTQLKAPLEPQKRPLTYFARLPGGKGTSPSVV